MMSGIISLIIALAILGIVYILFKWIVGMVDLPAPILQIANICFGVAAIVIVLKFLLALL